jgi:hypothetical protein
MCRGVVCLPCVQRCSAARQAGRDPLGFSHPVGRDAISIPPTTSKYPHPSCLWRATFHHIPSFVTPSACHFPTGEGLRCRTQATHLATNFKSIPPCTSSGHRPLRHEDTNCQARYRGEDDDTKRFSVRCALRLIIGGSTADR